jgi:hypothetical protein
MSRPYPAVPAPIALFDVLAGTFDPVAGVPVLKNGTGIENQRYIVAKAGTWNFVTVRRPAARRSTPATR